MLRAHIFRFSMDGEDIPWRVVLVINSRPDLGAYEWWTELYYAHTENSVVPWFQAHESFPFEQWHFDFLIQQHPRTQHQFRWLSLLGPVWHNAHKGSWPPPLESAPHSTVAWRDSMRRWIQRVHQHFRSRHCLRRNP